MTSVLAIAAIDSSGGAGLLRDTRTLADLGVDVLCVATAVTAQTNAEVVTVHHVPAAVVGAQMEAAFAGSRICAIKIGMLGTAATVEAVVGGLVHLAVGIPLILDPVLKATSGGLLLDQEGQAAMREVLFPLATLVTPNLPELACLLGCDPARNDAEAIAQGQELLSYGPVAVLIKGGHGVGAESVDHLLCRPDNSVRSFRLPRVNGSRRGTGCMLASAIAARIALGASLEVACQDAKRYVHSRLC